MPSNDPLDDSEEWDDPSWDDLSNWDDLDEDDSADAFSPTPHPDDRLWRHPAEVAAERRAAEAAAAAARVPQQMAFTAGPESPVATRSRPGRSVVFALATSALAGLMVFGGMQLGENPTDSRSTDSATGPVVTITTVASSAETEWRSTLKSRVEPGLPTIEVAMNGEMVTGGGIVINENGHIMTSAQLVKGASHIIVRDGDVRHEAILVGADLLTDVAVIHIDGLARPPASLAIDDELHPGQYALLNNTGGELTVGQITKINDQVDLDSGVRVYGLIETDIAAEESQPGTAIFDDRGLIIAMTPWTEASDVQGHAVPIRLADRVAQQIVATGSASHAWLGIQGSDAAIPCCPNGTHGLAGTPYDKACDTEAMYDTDLESDAAAVMSIQAKGPAEAAGLVEGDLIVSLGNQPIQSMSDLVSTLRDLTPGDDVDLTFIRDGQMATTTLQLGAVTD